MLLPTEAIWVESLSCHQISQQEGQVGLLEVSSSNCTMQDVARDELQVRLRSAVKKGELVSGGAVQNRSGLGGEM
jgi:hypothetical protein